MDSGNGWTNLFSAHDACSEHLNNYQYPFRPWSMANNGVHGWSAMPNWGVRNPICDVDTMCVYAHRYNGVTNEYMIRTLQENQDSQTSWARSMTPNCNSQAEACVLFGRGMQNTHHPYKGWIGETHAYTSALSD